jgi:hypothetical protein
MSSQLIITGFDPRGPFAGMFIPPALRHRQSKTRFKQEWRMPFWKYLALMREFKGPKRQQGIICATAVYGAAPGFVGNVVVNAHAFQHIVDDPANAESGVRFDTDGGLTEWRGALRLGQSGEWWDNEPDPGVGATFAVRALSGGSGTWTAAPAADNIWVTMTINRQWTVLRQVVGQKSASRTFQVGPEPAGPADDSAVISAFAQVEDVS